MDATEKIQDALKSNGLGVLGKVVGVVIIGMGVGFMIKSYFDLRNNLLEYQNKQYALHDYKLKYPNLKVKNY